ncbi:MAG: 3-hydroxyacyl-CoA dehydrogenase NAD-binding domain-containing protein [Steroidobacteraceae bacterium]
MSQVQQSAAPRQRFSNPLLIRPRRSMPQRIGVIGAGTIGPDIGYYLASEVSHCHLVLLDINPDALPKARARIAGYTEKGVKRGKLSVEKAAQVLGNLTTTTSYEDLRGCDWVLEAATENLDLKRRIFAQAEAVLAPDALITSNTSSLPAERLFRDLRHPGRATVTHFFAPAFQNPIVEVIDWPGLEPEALDDLRWFFAATGKVPMVTADQVCFMLDRIFDNWCNESGHLLAQASAAEIDSVAQAFVHAGPFFVLNLANGNPIIIETNTLQAEEEGAHYRPAPIFSSVERWHTVAPGKSVPVADPVREAVRDRLAGILYSQSMDILDRQIGSAADLELGCRLAFGFRQGPAALMRDAGAAEVDRVLARLRSERPGMPGRCRALDVYTQFARDILVDDVDGVRVITLRRPEALNALHDDLNDEILAAIQEAESNPRIIGFVITGYGPRAFSAGADIGRFPQLLGDARAAAEYARACSRVLVHLDRMRKPVVAALNGMALGGGLELAMRAHGIVAVRGANLQFPEITLGIVPGIGAMVVPYRRWPQAAATLHDMLRLGRRITTDTAAGLGMIDACVEPADLLPRAMTLVRELAGQPRESMDGPVQLPELPQLDAAGARLSAAVLGIMDRAIFSAAATTSLEAALEVGYQAFGESACTAAAREGIDAFHSARAPDFSRTG